MLPRHHLHLLHAFAPLQSQRRTTIVSSPSFTQQEQFEPRTCNHHATSFFFGKQREQTICKTAVREPATTSPEKKMQPPPRASADNRGAAVITSPICRNSNSGERRIYHVSVCYWTIKSG